MKTSAPYTIAAIPTRYRGCEFRSRLEATWAVFFDLAGWSWEYEPFDLKGWTPDFALRFKRPVLVECKPIIESCGESIRNLTLDFHDERFDLLVLPVGLGLHNQCGWISDNDGEFDEAIIYTCHNCREITLRSSNDGWHCRKHGCHDENAFVRKAEDFNQMWNEAKNAVRKKYTRAGSL